MDTVDTLTATIGQDPDGTPVVALAGHLDIATADTAQEALAQAMAGDTGNDTGNDPGNDPGNDTQSALVVDMTDLTFMDSTGLTVLLRAVRSGRALRLRRPTDAIRRIIAVTGLEATLPVEP